MQCAFLFWIPSIGLTVNTFISAHNLHSQYQSLTKELSPLFTASSSSAAAGGCGIDGKQICSSLSNLWIDIRGDGIFVYTRILDCAGKRLSGLLFVSSLSIGFAD